MSSTAFNPEQSPQSPAMPQTPDDGGLLSAFGVLQINDQSSVKINGDESASVPITMADGSPPTQRYTPPFARGTVSVIDPFVSQQATPSPARRHDISSTPIVKKSSRKADDMNKDWRSGSGSSDGAESSVTMSPSNARNYGRDTARRLSFGVPNGPTGPTGPNVPVPQLPWGVRANDAQGQYPPSCCVFVANLLQSESEETLQAAVTQVFREFGPVFVKIRRDSKQMPFAFCQFTQPTHAERAIKFGRGRLIKGRPCRCEKAKAHRLFFVERNFGDVPTSGEVRSLLEPFGSIEFCYTASLVERNALNLNEGIIIQFKLYDDGQSAQTAFRNNDQWKLVAINGMQHGSTRSPARASPEVVDSARAYISRYETDRASIFVGNLPVGIAEEQIKEIFEPYGAIVDVILLENISKFDPSDKFYFAFVEFQKVGSVSAALADAGHIVFHGKILRISQKNSEGGGSRRTVQTRSPAATISSPSMYTPPAAATAHHQASPMAPYMAAAPAYASPYSYGYGSPYYYQPNGNMNVIPEGQGFMYHNYTGYASYPGTPAYDPNSAAAQAAATTPSSTPYFPYGFPGYSYGPLSWASQAAQHPHSAPAAYPQYSPTMAVSTAPDDRSTTPTPAGNGAAVTDDFESQ